MSFPSPTVLRIPASAPHLAGSGSLLLAGQGGLLAERSDDNAPFQIAPELTRQDLHAVYGQGQVRCAVGGNLSQFGGAPPTGILLYRGE